MSEEINEVVEVTAEDQNVDSEQANLVTEEVVSAPVDSSSEIEEEVVAEEELTDEEKELAAKQAEIESLEGLQGDWYILQVYTGFEDKVKLSIDQRVADLGLQDKIFKVLIPMEDTVEIKNNKRVEARKRMYTGYVFINMFLDDDVWYSVRRINGVARFIGSGIKPEPVQESEMLRVLKQVGAKVKKIEIDFELGEGVRVVAGPFRGYTGVISEINAERGKVKVMMSIFGRETPMELEFDQLEKNG